MKISIIMPNRNGDRYIEQAIRSVLAQRQDKEVELEFLVIDGASTDTSLQIIDRYLPDIARVISEKDRGPASAINKGLRLATGEIIGWLNADDYYFPGALARMVEVVKKRPGHAIYFGRCPIIGETGVEIRKGITAFKECFFPASSRFTIQCINYLSQPATFFTRGAFERAGPLREDLRAAFDYEFFLRLWRQGGAARIPGKPVAAFRWHEVSISGLDFERQFREEYEAAVRDAGRFSPQALCHWFVRWGIVGSYSLMAIYRRKSGRRAGQGI